MILMLARIVACEAAGIRLAERLRGELARIADAAGKFPRRPRVFFEEWADPLISGIRWVDELVELAGGEPVFPRLREQHSATGRVVTPAEVVAANPDVIVASWCGRKVNKEQIRGRENWSGIEAVRCNNIYEIKSTYILQPGPAALTEGVRQLHKILARVAGGEPAPGLAPLESMDPDLVEGQNNAA
jgi:iron complex transport system substrate-binding protein